MNAIQIHPLDTVAVALLPLKAGATVCGVTLLQDIPQGHKFALMEISKDSNVIKYGLPIGHATANIRAGEHVHTHNVKTNLSETTEYVYRPQNLTSPPLLLQNLLLWGIFALMGEREFVMKSGLFQPLDASTQSRKKLPSWLPQKLPERSMGSMRFLILMDAASSVMIMPTHAAF